MPQSIFVFDFGSNEEAAQQARHKIESWKQGFRLGNKMLLKFERTEAAEADGNSEPETKAAAKGKTAVKKVRPKGEEAEKNGSNVRLLLRLNFSDHEKLTYQRWLDRIPAEEPFKSAGPHSVRTGDPEFPKTAELFDSLD